MEVVDFKLMDYSDLSFIAKVYNYYVENSTATFHTKTLVESEVIKAIPYKHSIYETFIIFYNSEPCGYCYIGNWKPREAYNRSAEITLYLLPEFHGKGIGFKTLQFLELKASEKGIKNLLGVITAENSGSVALFSKMGYEKVSHLKNIGEKFGRLLDVLNFQKEI